MDNKSECYNIIMYIKKYGQYSFDEKPLNVVDALIFSQLTLLDFDGIIPKTNTAESVSLQDVGKQFFKDDFRTKKRLGLILPQATVSMLRKMASTVRYQKMMLSRYAKIIDIDKEQQFCVVTIEVKKGFKYVVFCSTDDTIVGWKENFNLLYNNPTPSQLDAKDYINNLIIEEGDHLVLCGHSKGGNLAMYAHIHCDEHIYGKIIRTYNFDGPGFNGSVVNCKDCQKRLANVQTIVPEESVVGRLLEHYEPLLVTQSFEKLLYQHDVFSWCIKDDDLAYVSKLSNNSLLVEQKLKQMVEKLSDDEKKDIIETLYHWLIAQNSLTLTELSKIFPKHFPSFFKIEKTKRKIITGIVMELLKCKAIFVGTFKSVLEYRRYLKRRALNEIENDE